MILGKLNKPAHRLKFTHLTLKEDGRLKPKTWNYKTLRRKPREKIHDFGLDTDFLDRTSNAQATKAKMDQ